MQGVSKSISEKPTRRPKPRFIPGSAIQFFILKVDSFVGTQLFGQNMTYMVPTAAYALIMMATSVIFVFFLRKKT